jgi:hypothetical protein
MAPSKTTREHSENSLHLPKVNTSRMGGNNPFAMPKDLELYKSKMLEKEHKQNSRDQHVHMAKKGIKSNMEGKLRAFFKEP